MEILIFWRSYEMGTGIYRTKNGITRELTPSDVKNTIMRGFDVKKDEYKRFYNLFRNRYVNYQKFVKQQTGKTPSQSTIEILYRQAQARIKHGTNYNPSDTIRLITQFSSTSTGRYNPQSTESLKRANRIAKRGVEAFSQLIDTSPLAREVYQKSPNDFVAVDRLKTFADRLHKKQAGGSGIPTANIIGSDDASIWIDDLID